MFTTGKNAIFFEDDHFTLRLPKHQSITAYNEEQPPLMLATHASHLVGHFLHFLYEGAFLKLSRLEQLMCFAQQKSNFFVLINNCDGRNICIKLSVDSGYLSIRAYRYNLVIKLTSKSFAMIFCCDL